jgi:hypothetical protein
MCYTAHAQRRLAFQVHVSCSLGNISFSSVYLSQRYAACWRLLVHSCSQFWSHGHGMHATQGICDIRIGPALLQTLMWFDHWGSFPWGRDTYDTRVRRSPADCTDTSRWRHHNYRCGTWAVKKLTRYRTGVETIPTEGPKNHVITIRCVHIATQRSADNRSLWMQCCDWLGRQYTEDELRASMICRWRCVHPPQHAPLDTRWPSS